MVKNLGQKHSINDVSQSTLKCFDFLKSCFILQDYFEWRVLLARKLTVKFEYFVVQVLLWRGQCTTISLVSSLGCHLPNPTLSLCSLLKHSFHLKASYCLFVRKDWGNFSVSTSFLIVSEYDFSIPYTYFRHLIVPDRLAMFIGSC